MLKKEILMNVTPHETRVAIIENGIFKDIYIERINQRGIVGNIYKGKVIKVFPGMQACFVEIGLEKAGFLHLCDVIPLKNEIDEDDLNKIYKKEIPKNMDIRKWIKEGQKILVQVMKNPLGTKGARLTANISLPSRYLVYMHNFNHIGISLKIEDKEERKRLQNILNEALGDNPNKKGYIIRTVANNVKTENLVKDIYFLSYLWKDISERCQKINNSYLIHEDLNLSYRTLRDFMGNDVDTLKVDNYETFENLCKFSNKVIPNIRNKISFFNNNEVPIFDIYNIEQELEKALNKKVHLKSGGYLIIEQTEAMITIDVNTGKFVGSNNLDETIYKTNLEASKAIARQLRLRNLGGIIVIDFIDMKDDEHKQNLLSTFKNFLSQDYAKTNIYGISEIGLVEMTRKRTSESLAKILCEPCKVCSGNGMVKSLQTLTYEVFREIINESKNYKKENFLVIASEELINFIENDEPSSLAELESFTNKVISLKPEVNYGILDYDIVLI